MDIAKQELEYFIDMTLLPDNLTVNQELNLLTSTFGDWQTTQRRIKKGKKYNISKMDNSLSQRYLFITDNRFILTQFTLIQVLGESFLDIFQNKLKQRWRQKRLTYQLYLVVWNSGKSHLRTSNGQLVTANTIWAVA
jgi:hypothetical protein